MARKNQILLHIGPRPVGVTHTGLTAHHGLLAGVDHALAGIEQPHLDRAALEVLRGHRAAGLRRRDVEGSWAEACRSLRKARVDLVLSLPALAEADQGQAALVVDGLAGLDVHVVVTPEEGDDPCELVSHWSTHLKSGRMHVAPLADDAAGIDLAEELAGVALCIQQTTPGGRVARLRKRPDARGPVSLRPAS